MLEKGSVKHRPKVILEYDRKCRVRGGFDKLLFLGKREAGGGASQGVGDAHPLKRGSSRGKSAAEGLGAKNKKARGNALCGKSSSP